MYHDVFTLQIGLVLIVSNQSYVGLLHYNNFTCGIV